MSDDHYYLLSLVKGLRRSSSMLIDNLGIIVETSKIPAFVEYSQYTRHPWWVVRKYRQVFKQKRIHELQMMAQAAFMHTVLGQIEREIEP